MPPTFLIDSLNGIRRKVKFLSVAFGVNFPGGMRLILLVAMVGALGYAVVRWVVKPILARLTLSEVAGHVETVFPQFDDRLRSTVDFVQKPDSIPGSAFMKEQTVTQ